MEGYLVNLNNLTDGNLGNFSNNLVGNNITDGNLVAMDLLNLTNAGVFLDLPVLCGLTITNESLRIVQVSTGYTSIIKQYKSAHSKSYGLKYVGLNNKLVKGVI